MEIAIFFYLEVFPGFKIPCARDGIDIGVLVDKVLLGFHKCARVFAGFHLLIDFFTYGQLGVSERKQCS